MKTWSSGKSTNVGPGCGSSAVAQRLVDEPGDLGRRLGGRGQLRQRRDERDVVDLLQRALAPAHRRRAAAEHERAATPFCWAEPIALIPFVTPGPAVSAATPGCAGDLRPALGGERRGLLVAGVDEVDALLAAAVVDREQVAAREREQLRDAVGLQAPRDQPAAVDLGGLLRLGAHGGHHARCERRTCLSGFRDSAVSARRECVSDARPATLA